MYTPEERESLAKLAAEYTPVFETSIKEHEGGFIVTHSVTYVDDSRTVQARTVDTYVCKYPSEVLSKIDDLYEPLQRPRRKPEPAFVLPEATGEIVRG
jgi:acyl-CoA hydrolase